MSFKLGKTVITVNAKERLDSESVAKVLLDRYVNCDWGELCEEDKQTNEEALKYGGRLFGAYSDVNGTRFWIITEADRSYTTVLLPEDY